MSTTMDPPKAPLANTSDWYYLALVDLGECIADLGRLYRNPSENQARKISLALERTAAHLRCEQPIALLEHYRPLIPELPRIIAQIETAISNMDLVCKGAGLPPLALVELRSLVEKMH